MRRLIFALVLAPGLALAQPAPPTVVFTTDLAARIDTYLTSGGSHNEGRGLSREMRAAFEAQMVPAKPLSVAPTPSAAASPETPAPGGAPAKPLSVAPTPSAAASPETPARGGAPAAAASDEPK